MNHSKKIKDDSILVILYMAFSAFMVYTCMYGIRKPYTAASFSSYSQFGISYKVVLVTAQVIGYMISKFVGIRFIAELDKSKRKNYILLLILSGWLCLLFFAIVPFKYKFIFMLLNGLPLGMIWGIVFSYLEGRSMTDFLAAFLSVTFIFSSGFAKTIGGYLLSLTPTNEFWMPFFAGSIFILPLFIFTFLLNRSPSPSEQDKLERTERKPMSKEKRKAFVSEYGKFIFPAILTYALLTIIRDFSEDFSADLWRETGSTRSSAVFTQMSLISSLIVIIALALFYKIKKNITAFIGIHLFVIAGLVICIVSTYLFQLQVIRIFTWMVIATTGLYMGYVAKNCLYYERMLATYKIDGNVGFVMYIADAFGYMGTVLILLLKEFSDWQVNWINFFINVFYIAGFFGIILVIITLRGFYKKYQIVMNEK
jgi:MFS family permease